MLQLSTLTKRLGRQQSPSAQITGRTLDELLERPWVGVYLYLGFQWTETPFNQSCLHLSLPDSVVIKILQPVLLLDRCAHVEQFWGALLYVYEGWVMVVKLPMKSQ